MFYLSCVILQWLIVPLWTPRTSNESRSNERTYIKPGSFSENFPYLPIISIQLSRIIADNFSRTLMRGLAISYTQYDRRSISLKNSNPRSRRNEFQLCPQDGFSVSRTARELVSIPERFAVRTPSRGRQSEACPPSSEVRKPGKNRHRVEGEAKRNERRRVVRDAKSRNSVPMATPTSHPVLPWRTDRTPRVVACTREILAR